MLCGDIKGDLGKKKVRADAGGRWDVQPARDLVHELFGKRFRVHAVGLEIACRVYEHLVDGVDMDIVRRKIVKVN